jgi:cell division septum initiation protein DivIVA
VQDEVGMLYNDLMTTLVEKVVSKEERNKQLEELKKFIKSHNHLYDDCSFAIIGAANTPQNSQKKSS